MIIRVIFSQLTTNILSSVERQINQLPLGTLLRVLSHRSTVILIELPCYSFCDRMEAAKVDEAEGLSTLLDDNW